MKENVFLKSVNSMTIYVTEEGHVTKSAKGKWELEWSGKIIPSYGTNRGKGYLILLNKF